MKIEDYEIARKCEYIPYTFNGTQYLLNKDLYLDIVITDFCNAKCNFCVAHLVHKKERCDVETFKRKIKYAVEEMGIKEVLLLGGEATIDNRLLDILDYLPQLNLRKVCLTTNGHRMASDIEYANRLLSSCITHMNISVMSLDVNKQLAISNGKVFVGENSLKSIYEIAKSNGVHVRVNNNVFVGNHDNVDEIIEFYNRVKHYCDSVKFSPLLRTDSFGTVNKVTKWNDEHILSPEQYDKLWHEVEDHWSEYPILRNKETLGFVEYSMILTETPIILNYNQHNQLKQKFETEKKINSLKLLTTGDLSFSWNRERRDLVIC